MYIVFSGLNTCEGGERMGYRVKELRESMGLSQEELARISGVSRTIISGLENGTTRATTTKTLIKLAEALGCAVDCIFFTNDV